MTVFTIAVLGVIVAVLLVERWVTARAHDRQVERLQTAVLDANRQAITAVLSRDGSDFARNESIGRAAAEQLSRTYERATREPQPMAEGL